MEILSRSTPKARKLHRCDFCGLFIQIGERYEITNIKADDLYTWKNHIPCGQIADTLNMFDDYDEGLTSESFRENINEEYSRIMSDKYNELYESVDFIEPYFSKRLEFVINELSKS